MQRPLRSPLLLAALAALLAALPGGAAADDVHLANGKVFEGVEAQAEGGWVRIRLAFGELSLPAEAVAGIFESDTALATYLARREALETRRAGAPDWLELARWAAAHGLDHGAREAGLRAAALDPQMAGLEDVLGPYGFVFDGAAGRWLGEDEAMRRRGFVRIDGEWIGPEELAARERRRREERADRLAAAGAAADARLARAIEALALAQLVEERAEAASRVAGWRGPGWPHWPAWPVWPVVVVPGFAPSPPHEDRPGTGGPGRRHDQADAFLRRPPGSLESADLILSPGPAPDPVPGPAGPPTRPSRPMSGGRRH